MTEKMPRVLRQSGALGEKNASCTYFTGRRCSIHMYICTAHTYFTTLISALKSKDTLFAPTRVKEVVVSVGHGRLLGLSISVCTLYLSYNSHEDTDLRGILNFGVGSMLEVGDIHDPRTLLEARR